MMDTIYLLLLAAFIITFIIILTLYLQQQASRNQNAAVFENATPQRAIRHTTGVRNRHLAQMNYAANREEVGPQTVTANDGIKKNIESPFHKIGTKKKAKLEAKAEKRAQRDAIEQENENRKKREKEIQDERDKENENERLLELKKEEAKRKAKEIKENEEHAEYLKIKAAFTIEEDGFEEYTSENENNLLQEFIKYIRLKKVVLLEDLAVHFTMKTLIVLDRIQKLQLSGDLTGVIDDRGKFVYISENELRDIGNFVRGCGRISITELAENSNQLININYVSH
ncbi:DDRGK domain-containing protein 1-like [Prorops nasuta]|uniref:DDRGK domain-containing protein 1-like n=1 Tax=Prorops nasuta TaxID=863751 RepID=UPI0034CFD06E